MIIQHHSIRAMLECQQWTRAASGARCLQRPVLGYSQRQDSSLSSVTAPYRSARSPRACDAVASSTAPLPRGPY